MTSSKTDLGDGWREEMEKRLLLTYPAASQFSPVMPWPGPDHRLEVLLPCLKSHTGERPVFGPCSVIGQHVVITAWLCHVSDCVCTYCSDLLSLFEDLVEACFKSSFLTPAPRVFLSCMLDTSSHTCLHASRALPLVSAQCSTLHLDSN